MMLALLVTLAFGGGPHAAAPLKWENRLEDALRKAKAARKPVMVDFWADW